MDDYTASRLALLIAKAVLADLKNEESRRDFDEWYLQKYGEPYDPSKISSAKEGEERSKGEALGNE